MEISITTGSSLASTSSSRLPIWNLLGSCAWWVPVMAFGMFGCGPGILDPDLLQNFRVPDPEELSLHLEVDPPFDPVDYRVDSGDRIRIEVRDRRGEMVDDATVELTVPTTGDIVYTYLDRIQVSGRTVRSLQVEVEEGLVQRRVLDEPIVQIFVTQHRRRSVQVNGAVKAPGSYSLSTRERRSLRVLLLMAGGPVPHSDVTRISIFRKMDLTRHSVSWWDLAEKGEKFFLEQGDVIEVPEAAPIQVRGEVGSEGEIPYAGEKTTFLYVIRHAGNLTKFANRDVIIRRRNEDGTIREFLPVDFDEVESGRMVDFVLHPGDEVVVESADFLFN